jgi:glycosyltransferase involved in cell wall biosynthesis
MSGGAGRERRRHPCRTSAIILNLFYEEPDGDRWLSFDRYPRRMVRRVLRGRPPIWGHRRTFLNLCAGLDRIGIRYRVNDYRHARRNPRELACIVGKPFVLDKMTWRNPILFGPATFDHPIDDPDLFQRRPVRKVVVYGAWLKEMWKPYWDEPIVAWPVGIDTDTWRPAPASAKRFDVLLYDKVRWEHDRYDRELIEPTRRALRAAGRSFREIRYGFYREEDFHAALAECRVVIFLCEHETQGIAYQQALACGTPIFAWNRGGAWRDPAFYPDRVTFEPVSSIPYWDERCGGEFAAAADFEMAWPRFWDEFRRGAYDPRAYIMENLTLEKCAANYVAIAKGLA